MRSIALALLFLVPLAASAKSKKKPITVITAEEVAEMVAADGEVEITKDSVGDPLIRVAGDFSYVVQFYDCTDKGCGTLQFRGWWSGEGLDIPYALFSEFEMTWRIGRVFKDNSGAPVVELLVPLDGGVTRSHLELRHQDFLSVANGFQGFLAENLGVP